MRFLIQFADKTSMIVSQRDGEQVGQALAAGESIILKGAFINPRFISIIKPIKKGWFTDEYVAQQERAELASPDSVKFLPAPSRE